MSKAFTKETDGDDDDQDEAEALPAGQKNYVTPAGFAALKNEWCQLLHEERPKIVEVVSWAAGNGDRSENGDYIYGKKRLREIDRRVRYLTKRIENAVIVDAVRRDNADQIFFGATVEYVSDDNVPKIVTIVGLDEADMGANKISWLSPVARAMMKARAGDVVEVRTPVGLMSLEIVSVRYGDAKDN